MSSFREKWWEEWIVKGGAIRFNHADGVVELRKNYPSIQPSPSQAASGSIPAPPSPVEFTPDSSNVVALALQNPGNVFSLCLEENVYYLLYSHVGGPTAEGGDLSKCPWLHTKNTWRPVMQPRAELVEKILEAFDVYYPKCLLCTNPGGFAEHLPAQKHLRQLQDRLPTGKPVTELAAQFWQEWILPLGILRFNHLHGQVWICRGKAPRQAKPMPFPSSSTSNEAQQGPLSSKALRSPPMPSSTSPQTPSRPVPTRAAAHGVEDPQDLAVEGVWFVSYPPCSEATQVDGDYRAYPHLCGKAQFKKCMTPRAGVIERILRSQAIPREPQCTLCERHRGYQEHLGAAKHWDALYPYAREGVCIEAVRDRLWNTMMVSGGWVRINELDGAIEIAKGSKEPGTRSTVNAEGPPAIQQGRAGNAQAGAFQTAMPLRTAAPTCNSSSTTAASSLLGPPLSQPEPANSDRATERWKGWSGTSQGAGRDEAFSDVVSLADERFEVGPVLGSDEVGRWRSKCLRLYQSKAQAVQDELRKYDLHPGQIRCDACGKQLAIMEFASHLRSQDHFNQIHVGDAGAEDPQQVFQAGSLRLKLNLADLDITVEKVKQSPDGWEIV